jgi:Ca2+-binding RTX toxin-like protein
MIGGAGDDYYRIDVLQDAILETSGAGSGSDSVLANVNGYTLAANVETLILGTAISGFGNALANTLVGSTNNDLLFGNGGNDSVSGGVGNDNLQGALGTSLGRGEIDTLTGGAGNDVFILGSTAGAFYNDGSPTSPGITDYALVTDFQTGTDRLQLKGSAANYYLGAHTVPGLSGEGLFLEAGATDELVAVIQGAGVNTANTITNAVFV